MKFAKFLRTPFLQNISRRLLLDLLIKVVKSKLRLLAPLQNFKTHVEDLYMRFSRNIHALARIRSYMDFPPKKQSFLMLFFKSEFNYSPLTWRCHSCRLINKTNALHERCLRISYNEKQPTFQEFLDKDKFVSLHKRNRKKNKQLKCSR